LLEQAGVREARLHDARHTAATTLLLLGVPERAVMDVMGWSNAAMVSRYAHVTARLRRDIADRAEHVPLGRQMRLQMRLNRPEDTRLAARGLHSCWSEVVVRGGVKPPTFRFSGVADAQVSLEHARLTGCLRLRWRVDDCRRCRHGCRQRRRRAGAWLFSHQ